MAKINSIMKAMTRKEIRQLALAVFFLFAAIGPISMLMDRELQPNSWYYLTILTILSGTFSASIILFMGRIIPLILSVAVFASLMFTFRLWTEEILPQEKKQAVVADHFFKFSQEELQTIESRRVGFGLTAIFCLSAGYALFLRVIDRQAKRRAEAETEMKFAEQVHGALLPETPLSTQWCEVAGVSIPSLKIGGDYFDIISLSDSKILCIIADASGYGTGAGVLAAMTKSSILQELQHTQSLSQMLSSVNRTIYSVTERNMFVTCALIVLDKQTMTAEYITAGHPPILRQRTNMPRLEEFRTQHLALGLQQEYAFQTATMELQKGDTFFLFSDGLVDAANLQKEQFGIDRLKELILDTERPTADHMSASLIASVREFTINKEFQDDATLIVSKILV